MATGNGSSGSLSLSSDQVFDRNCTVCEEDNTMSEAVCYCTVCYKYYCTPCQKSHNQVLRDHRDKLIDKVAMLKGVPKPPAREPLTTKCEKHDKLVEIFCRDHNVVCCTVCVALQHKKCQQTEYIPDIADGYSKNSAVATIKADLQAVRKDMMAVKSSRKSDQTRIEREREHVLTQVKDCRRRMNEVFDRLEEAAVRGADIRYEEFGDNIQADLEKCDKALNKIEETIQGLERTDANDEAQLFIHVKQSEERIDQLRKLSDEITESEGDTIKFVLDEDIEKYLRNLQKLGEFVDEMRKSSKPRLVDRNELVIVRMKKDRKTCSILGSCCLPEGGVLLSDYSNNQLKRLSSSYQVTDTCSITRPQGVCYMEQSDEAAVCVFGAIKIVSLGSTMSVVRSVDINNTSCYGVASRNNLLYVTENCLNQLHVVEYDTGRHVTTVDADKRGQEMFSRTLQVTTTDDGREIVVVDYDKGLVVIDNDYNLQRVTKVDGVDGARCVCVDKQNTVFVCCDRPCAVLQLNRNGDRICTLLQGDDLPGTPSSVCYDENRSRLVVTMWDTNTIKVVHFK